MGITLGFTTVKAARKEHTCTYCGELILRGSSYKRWFWAEGYDSGPGTMHPECFAAFEDSGEEYYELYGQQRPAYEEQP